jgi:hypothetical protein
MSRLNRAGDGPKRGHFVSYAEFIVKLATGVEQVAPGAERS